MTDTDIAELRRRMLSMESKCDSIDQRVEEYWRDTRAQAASIKDDVHNVQKSCVEVQKEQEESKKTLQSLRKNVIIIKRRAGIRKATPARKAARKAKAVTVTTYHIMMSILALCALITHPELARPILTVVRAITGWG